MKMREGGVSCGQKRLLEEQRLARKTKTFETQRKGGSRGKELLRALVALLALMIRSDLHQTFYFLPSSDYSVPLRFKGFHSRIIKAYLWLTDISTEPSSRDHSRCRELTTSL